MPVTLATFDPNPDGSCRVCRGALDPESWLCVRCGAAHGERNRCPHCQSIARTLPHRTLVRVCSVCGRPRFSPLLGPTSPNANATHLLHSSGHAARMGQVLKYVAYVLLALGGLGLLLTATVLLILMPGAWVSGIAITLLAVLPLLLGLIVRNRAKSSLEDSHHTLEQAYEEGILGLLQTSGAELDSDAIAQRTGLPLERTEHALAKLNVDARMSSRVTDEGSIVYALPGSMPEPNRLRVDAPATRVPATHDGITDAELDADSDLEHGAHQTRRPRQRP